MVRSQGGYGSPSPVQGLPFAVDGAQGRQDGQPAPLQDPDGGQPGEEAHGHPLHQVVVVVVVAASQERRLMATLLIR